MNGIDRSYLPGFIIILFDKFGVNFLWRYSKLAADRRDRGRLTSTNNFNDFAISVPSLDRVINLGSLHQSLVLNFDTDVTFSVLENNSEE